VNLVAPNKMKFGDARRVFCAPLRALLLRSQRGLEKCRYGRGKLEVFVAAGEADVNHFVSELETNFIRNVSMRTHNSTPVQSARDALRSLRATRDILPPSQRVASA
jgi:hypothetical protein